MRHIRNSFVYTLGACLLLKGDHCKALYDKQVLIVGGKLIFSPDQSDFAAGFDFCVPLGVISQTRVDDPAAFESDLAEFFKFARRNLIKEAYEVGVSYHRHVTGKDEPPHNQTWFPFAHVIRNAVTHDFKIAYGKHDRGRLPIVWENVTLEASDDGGELTLHMTNPLATAKLLEAIEAYIQTTP